MVVKGDPGAGAGVEPMKLFQKGLLVEVGSDEEGFKDAWYVAIVIDTPSTTTTNVATSSASKKKIKNHNHNNNPESDKYLIEYKALLDDDGLTPLREHVKPEFVRPLPPIPSDADLAHSFSLFEVVDAFSRDGWWTGVITRIVDQNTFVVAFQNPPDVVEFRVSDLRIHRSWIDGKWVRPENQRRISKSIFRAGMKAEASFDNDDYRDVWFPATVLDDLGNESFMVEYQTIGNGNNKTYLKGIADLQHIRPSPVFPKEKKFKFDLLEKVDAFYNFCWWGGVITKELAGNRYIVYFKHKIKEMEFNYSDLRPHVEWKDGEWTASSPDIIVRSNSQEQVRPQCISAADSIAVGHTLGAKKGNSVERTPRALDNGENHTLESTPPCNGKPSSNGVTSARRITSPKTPGIGASQSIHAHNTCALNKAVTTVPSKKNPRFSSSSVAGAKTSSLQQSVDGDHLAAETRSNTLTEEDLAHSRNDISAPRKRGRPPKSPLVAAADVLLTGGSGSKNRSNPTRSKRATGQSVEKHPVKKLKLPNRGEMDISGPKTGSSVEDPQQAAAAATAEEGAGDAIIDQVPSRGADDQPLSTWFEDMHTPQPPVNDSRASPIEVEDSTTAVNNEAAGGTSNVAPGPNQSSAFARTSPLWRMIDGMEVFQAMPQNPHFGPLNSCKESCREGLAIGWMVTFASVVKKISELRFDEPRSCIEENLETIRELESQGFDVKMLRDRLNGLLLIKDKHDLLEVRSKELQTQIVERSAEKTRTDDEIGEINKQMKALQEKRALAMSKMKVKDSEIASLKSSEESVNEGMRSIHDDFAKLASAPWVMMNGTTTT